MKGSTPRVSFSAARATFVLEAQARLEDGQWQVGALWVDRDSRALEVVCEDSGAPLEASGRWALAYLALAARIERECGERGAIVPTPHMRRWQLRDSCVTVAEAVARSRPRTDEPRRSGE